MAPRKPRTKTAPQRPADLGGVLRELHLSRPGQVPERATLLVAFVNLPGDNTQRGEHWAVKKRWQDAARHDMHLCLAQQPHPGLLDEPMVYVEMHVAAVGDEWNRPGRAKFIIDRLQVRREVEFVRDGKKGVRIFGDLDIIRDDKALNKTNCVFEEVRVKPAERKVLVWVWDKEAA